MLHADDFGLNESVTEGILHGFTHGLLTSTSMLTNAPGCEQAIAQWKRLRDQFDQDELPSLAARQRLADRLLPFDLGAHLNLTQGWPLTGCHYPPQLLDRQGRFPGVFALAARLAISGWKYRAAIHNELCAQIEVLLNNAISPTHLNSHQYIEMMPIVAAIIPGLLKRYAIPVVRVPWETRLTQTTLLRREPANWCLAQIKRIFAFHYLIEMQRLGVAHPASFFGTSHAGRIDAALMRMFLGAARPGVTEVGMHPGFAALDTEVGAEADGWCDPLFALRANELSLLCSPELSDMIEATGLRLGRLSELSEPHILRAAA